MKQEPKSLIMCMTPLQILIAEKIITLNSNERFDLLVVALNDNKKYKTYFERVKKLCVNSLYYVQGKGRLVFFDYIKKLKKHNLNNKYNNYYLAGIDSRHCQYILSKNKNPNIFTFDDGTANIITSSLYYSNSKPNFLKRAGWGILGIKHYMKEIKEASLLHYTIYDGIPNIIDNKVYISLVSKEKNIEQKTSEVVSFYLGQPLTEISKNFDLSYVINNIDKLNIDYYYPHPREKSYPEGKFQLVDNPLIFEDYIVQFLEKYPDIAVEVFSFTSTALLNIMSLDRVKVTYIHDTEFFELNHRFYEFTKKSFGIEHINLDSLPHNINYS